MSFAHIRPVLALALPALTLGLGIALFADTAEARGRGKKGPRVAGFAQTSNGNGTIGGDNGDGLMPKTVFGSVERFQGRTKADRYYRQTDYLRP